MFWSPTGLGKTATALHQTQPFSCKPRVSSTGSKTHTLVQTGTKKCTCHRAVFVQMSPLLCSRVALQRSSGLDETGPVVWHLALCLLLSSILVALALIRGIKSSGKVSQSLPWNKRRRADRFLELECGNNVTKFHYLLVCFIFPQTLCLFRLCTSLLHSLTW